MISAQVEVTDSGITIVKARHPEFFLNLEEPTSLYYDYYEPDFFREKKLKAFRLLSYATDYRSRLSDLGNGDFIYVLHRFGEDEYPKRYVIVSKEKLTHMKGRIHKKGGSPNQSSTINATAYPSFNRTSFT